MQAYCVKCRAKREMKETKKGKPSVMREVAHVHKDVSSSDMM